MPVLRRADRHSTLHAPHVPALAATRDGRQRTFPRERDNIEKETADKKVIFKRDTYERESMP